MTQQADSIVAHTVSAHDSVTVASHSKGWHSPAEIIGWLPETATPWQQDSMLRAHYKYVEKDWLHAPNPMRTPTTKADPILLGRLDEPLYHSQSMVQPDSVYRPEIVTYGNGVAGDPVPYTISGDSLITSLLLLCFVLATVAMARSSQFLKRQIKNFFRTQREGTTVISETSGELRVQAFLVAQTCLLFAIIFFFYSSRQSVDAYSIAHYKVLGLLTATFLGYFVMKAMLYTVVNWVFFSGKKNEQWMKAALFLVSSEGILLFPIVLLLAYFHLSIESAVILTSTVVVFVKFLTFYKTHIIFFRRTVSILQSFLYFCTIEMMPLGILWGILAMMSNYLKQIF